MKADERAVARGPGVRGMGGAEGGEGEREWVGGGGGGDIVGILWVVL